MAFPLATKSPVKRLSAWYRLPTGGYERSVSVIGCRGFQRPSSGRMASSFVTLTLLQASARSSTGQQTYRSSLRGARPSFAWRRHGNQQLLVGFNSQIQHVVINYMENRTPENLFGAYWNTRPTRRRVTRSVRTSILSPRRRCLCLRTSLRRPSTQFTRMSRASFKTLRVIGAYSRCALPNQRDARRITPRCRTSGLQLPNARPRRPRPRTIFL